MASPFLGKPAHHFSLGEGGWIKWTGYFVGTKRKTFVATTPPSLVSNVSLANCILSNSLPPANEVCQGYVFTCVCQSFCSQEGVVSQHALQVSGGCYSRMPCRSPGPHPGGSLRGLETPAPKGKLRGLARGVSRPTPGRGVSRPTPGRVYPSMH